MPKVKTKDLNLNATIHGICAFCRSSQFALNICKLQLRIIIEIESFSWISSYFLVRINSSKCWEKCVGKTTEGRYGLELTFYLYAVLKDFIAVSLHFSAFYITFFFRIVLKAYFDHELNSTTIKLNFGLNSNSIEIQGLIFSCTKSVEDFIN